MMVKSDVGRVHDGEDERGDSDKDWPERDGEARESGVDDYRVESDGFKNVGPMSSLDDGRKHAHAVG